jgi:hypothetical protein
MNNSQAEAYLKSSACISTQTLTIPEGEVAYVFASGAVGKPNGTISGQSHFDAKLPSILVDIDGLDANSSLGNWTASGANFNSSSSSGHAIPSNISSSVQPIAGPATIKLVIKPKSARSSSGYSTSRWIESDAGNWDFQASEGYVTFRIVGSEKEVSKKFATVIPENASTNIRVVLEQSTDLINWTTAAPGVFPPSTAKRFFRVRSEEE